MTGSTGVRTPRAGAGAQRGRPPSESPAGTLTYVLLVLTIVLSALPLYWMFVVGSSGEDDVFRVPPPTAPGDALSDNVRAVFAADNVFFLASLVNSLLVAVVVTASVLVFCSLAGFAFAKLRFRGRNPLMFFLILTMTVPNQLGVVALYIVMGKFDLNGTPAAVILPGLVTAFGVFYMRQFIVEAVPDELIEAARVDGASTLRIFRSVVAPTLRPALGVLGLFTFTASWNDFQWPLITLSGSEYPTVQVALSNLASGQYVVFSRLLAGALLATLPLLIVFVVAGKQIVAGIMEGAVKS
ncbi:carbohydrate ABC transporter permease [Actinoplanes sp. NPDC049118]|uniref:carbohydrate ABC transporter permease n=1 Tax=Actinoplanes sp. NPDC049118 TaxID=3155769 RepID=UPI0033C8E616